MTSGTPSRHEPVLLEEVVRHLAPRPGDRVVDGTVGGGGHALALLEATAPGGRLLGLDRDPAALERAAARLAPYGARVELEHANFADLVAACDRHGLPAVERILLDLGFSSDQIDDPARGLSFRHDGPLDMRLDPGAPVRAADLVNGLDAPTLADVLYRYGDERRSRRIARAIIAARPVTTTTRLAEIVARSAGRRGDKIHPATRTFQALRIAVNDELAALERALPAAIGRLSAGGRLAVISFHSLEDRIVKHTLRDAARDCICPPELPACACTHRATVTVVTRRPVRPTPEEIEANPRARSARMRVAERLADRAAA